jgi:hypothetical protein
MHCVKCRTETRYNRAVVTLDDEEIRGGLCTACEREAFGRTLIDRPFGHLDGCVECPNPGVVATPEHTIEVSIETDNEYVTEGYTADDETPVFCAEHFPAGVAHLRPVHASGEVAFAVDRP